LTGTMTLDVGGGVEWSGKFLVHTKYWLGLTLSAASLGVTQVTIEVTPTAERCNDSTFGLGMCSNWCNVKGYWGCGTSTLVGIDGRNTYDKDYTCSCDGCNGCDPANGGCSIHTVSPPT
jgi:hypothetical protein